MSSFRRNGPSLLSLILNVFIYLKFANLLLFLQNISNYYNQHKYLPSQFIYYIYTHRCNIIYVFVETFILSCSILIWTPSHEIKL
jgi:hypothetical protein